VIRRLGVEFVCGVAVGADISLNDLDSQYNAVFMGIGTWKESWVYLPEPNCKCLSGIALPGGCRQAGNRFIQASGVVIGGGNAAIDSARTSLRLGAEVTVVYRREPQGHAGHPEETEAAEAEGVHFVFLATPHRIVGDESGKVKAIEVVKTRLGEFDSTGPPPPHRTNEIRRFECEAVILAVGEAVDMDFVRASGLRIKENGTLEVDRYTLETSRSKFYAGGDLISGASNVSNAMGYGKKAARTMDYRLMGGGRWGRIAQPPSTTTPLPSIPPSAAATRRGIAGPRARGEFRGIRGRLQPQPSHGRILPLSPLRTSRSTTNAPANLAHSSAPSAPFNLFFSASLRLGGEKENPLA